MRVSILGQHSPTPTPTATKGTAMAQTIQPPEPKGIITPKISRPAAEIQGPTLIMASARGFGPPALMKDPAVQPADINTIQYPAIQGDWPCGTFRKHGMESSGETPKLNTAS